MSGPVRLGIPGCIQNKVILVDTTSADHLALGFYQPGWLNSEYVNLSIIMG
jgi:hypothetical protein